jgi:predicted nucleic-acid-binding protein
MTGLDTAVLVRYLTQDHLAQARKANAMIDGAVGSGERLHLDVVVLCELVWVLRSAYGFGKQTVIEALAKILEAAQFSVDDRDLLREGLEAYQGGQGDLADYVLGLRNRKAGCGATVTFDRALKRTSYSLSCTDTLRGRTTENRTEPQE